MAGIVHDNRTLTFGPDNEFRITEKELAEIILDRHPELNTDDVTDLVTHLIDALDHDNNPPEEDR